MGERVSGGRGGCCLGIGCEGSIVRRRLGLGDFGFLGDLGRCPRLV